jgi:hypothetical protein
MEDLDFTPEVAGLNSVLIVPCNMCPAITVAVREGKPFLRLFRSLWKSAPFERYIEALQNRLADQGVKSEVFRSPLHHQWFVCMWTSRRRARLQRRAMQHDAVVLLGCDSAAETIHDAIRPIGKKIIKGMKVSGFMNARMKLRLPCDISFEDCRIIPISPEEQSPATDPRSDAG